MRRPRLPRKAIKRFFELTLNRQFSEAERVLESIEDQIRDVEWSRGYIQALKGMILVQRTDYDRYAFLSNIDLEDVESLRRNRREFLGHSRNKLHADYDRGFFSAWADLMDFLLNPKGAGRGSKRRGG